MPRFKFGALPSYWARTYTRNFRRVVADLPQKHQIVESMRGKTQQYFGERADGLSGRKGKMIAAMCSCVLASYRSLIEHDTDREEAFSRVRKSFGDTGATPMRWFFRLWLKLARDPVAQLQKRSMAAFASRMYGTAMEFADEQDEDSYSLLVRRCAFHEFFASYGEPNLTVAVCDWDRNWMDIVDRSARPIRMERNSTISTGGDCCRFRYVRDEDKQLSQERSIEDDVVLVQLQHSPSVGHNQHGPEG